MKRAGVTCVLRGAVAVAFAAVAALGGHAGAAGKKALVRGAPPPNTAAPATAAPAPGMPGGPPLAVAIGSVDRGFVTTALSTALLELEASRLAVERSKHPQLRALAQRIVEHHRAANEELAALAKDAGMADVPSTTTGKYTGMLEKLRALKDADFDREYAAQIGVASHTESVARYEQAAAHGQDPALKAFADRQLPVLREHLQASETVARAVGVSDARLQEASALPPDLATGARPAAAGTTGSEAPRSPVGRSDGAAKAPAAR